MARFSRYRLGGEPPPVATALLVIKVIEDRKLRYRFYTDGLTVFEVAMRHGDRWHPWRIQFSEWLPTDEQIEALLEASDEGFSEVEQ